jgi:hypothetical protein
VRQVHARARVPAARAARARAAVPGARAHARRSGAEVRLCLSAGRPLGTALRQRRAALQDVARCCKMVCRCDVVLWCLAERLCRRGRWFGWRRTETVATTATGRAARAAPSAVRASACCRTAGRAHGAAVVSTTRMRRHFWLRSLMELARASSRSEEPPALQCLREARRGGAWLHAAAGALGPCRFASVYPMRRRASGRGARSSCAPRQGPARPCAFRSSCRYI